ncbi:MAG: hypothetical protein JW797_05370 [Bradymonadales bacterium]|nr:hypothetical protein [Bradymonadales bacterium]
MYPIFRHKPLLIALIGMWLGVSRLGCTPADQTPPEDDSFSRWDEALSGRIAYLSVGSRNAHGPADNLSLEISAQFVDFRNVEQATVRQSLGLWTPDETLPSDGCSLGLQPSPSGLETWSPSRVLLVDAGIIRVEGRGDLIELVPRRIPDLFPFLRGYTYGTGADEGPFYPCDSLLEIRGFGSDQVEPFSVMAHVPHPLAITHINELSVGSMTALELHGEQEGLLVRWTPALRQDSLQLTLEPDGRGAGVVLSCSAFDDGEFFLSEREVMAVMGSDSRGSFRLTAHRATMQPFPLAGFDTAEAVAYSEHSLILY